RPVPIEELGWRSVTVLWPRLALVLSAEPDAPEFSARPSRPLCDVRRARMATALECHGRNAQHWRGFVGPRLTMNQRVGPTTPGVCRRLRAAATELFDFQGGDDARNRGQASTPAGYRITLEVRRFVDHHEKRARFVGCRETSAERAAAALVRIF